MLLMILLLAIIFGVIKAGFHITGAIITGLVWACIKLPLALMFGGLGIAFCATLILIPLGLVFFRFASFLLRPCV